MINLPIDFGDKRNVRTARQESRGRKGSVMKIEVEAIETDTKYEEMIVWLLFFTFVKRDTVDYHEFFVVASSKEAALAKGRRLITRAQEGSENV